MPPQVTHQSLELSSPARLRVSNIRGSVHINSTAGNLIQVKAVKHTHTGNPDHTQIQIEQAPDGSITVAARWDRARFFDGFDRPCKVDFFIQTPLNCALRVKTVSSSLSVEGITGSFNLKTVSGPLNVNDLAGELLIETVSGRLAGRQLRGPATVKSVSGKIDIHHADLPRLSASTVSGRMHIQTPLTAGPYHLKSVSGDLKLIAPPDTACTVRAKSMSGRFKTSLPATRSQVRRRRWDVDLAGGGPELHMSSVSGNLYLVSSQDDRVTEPHSHAPSPQQRRQILEQLENGELTLEAALNTLRGT